MGKTQVQKAIEAEIKRNGIEMCKKLSSGGFLGTPTYDNRKVYSLEELDRLNGEGFYASSDLGIFLFNALMRDTSKKKEGA